MFEKKPLKVSFEVNFSATHDANRDQLVQEMMGKLLQTATVETVSSSVVEER